MKQFAKSLVSIVIALSVLATMCVVGISVSAKVHEFVLVSETEAKNKTDLKATKDGGVTVGTVDVVNTSTLGTPPAGAPATAYKFTIANAKDGVHFTAKSDDASALSAKTTELVFDAWIYVSDVSKCGNLLFRMYGSAGPQAGGNGNIEGYVWQGSVSGAAMSAKTGWNHVQVPMTFSNGWQSATSDAMTAYKADMKITGISLHDHSLAASNSYDVAVASIKLTYDDGVVEVIEKEFADFTDDTKDLADYHKTRTNADEELSLVDVSTLNKGNVKYAGPSTNAVKIDLSKVDGSVYGGRKGGIYTSLETPVRLKSEDKEADYVVDMWLYLEGTTHDFLVQFYTAGQESSSSGTNTTETWLYRYEFKSLVAGWNHVTLKLSDFKKDGATGSNGFVEKAWEAFRKDAVVTGMSFHENVLANNTAYTLYVADVTLCHKDYAADANNVPEKDSNKSGITVVSANIDKKVDDMIAVGAANISVVKTSTLKGGAAGVPSKDAYMVTDAAKQNGFKVPVVNPDWSAPANSLNSAQTHALKGYGLNMWIWVSDATKVGGTFVARFCEEGKNTSGLGNWTYQFTSAQSGTAGYKISWQTGWNNVTFWLPDTGDFDHRTNMNSDGKTITEVIFEDHTTTGTYSFAVACARLVKGQAEAEAGWGIGSGTGDAVDVAMIVVAILLAAMAASVTVYFGKKAR